jgi:hypothetical protein
MIEKDRKSISILVSTDPALSETINLVLKAAGATANSGGTLWIPPDEVSISIRSELVETQVVCAALRQGL